MTDEFGAAVLFDLPRESSIYRVFLLPGMLQVDLSFTPASDFGSRGPRFQLLFGEAVQHAAAPPEPSAHLFGLAVHHLVRAAICIERERYWQAEFWIHLARDDALSLACRRYGLNESEGRGFDMLPQGVRDGLLPSLVGTLHPTALRQAISTVLAVLLEETTDSTQQARVRPMVEALLQQ
jgi:hypothetical protein